MGKIFAFISLFYTPYLFRQLRRQILQLPKGTQIFVMNRTDLGTSIQTLRYATDWQESLGPTAIVLLSTWNETLKKKVEFALPQAKVITPNPFWLNFFGKKALFFSAYVPTVARLVWEFPNIRFLYYQSPESNALFPPGNYSLEVDYASSYSLCSQFVEAAKNSLFDRDLHKENFAHAIELINKGSTKKRSFDSSEIEEKLNLASKYVLLNVPKSPFANFHFRRIGQPERYNVLIDALIARGYKVVVHGRGEQPHFDAREGLIDYAHSPHPSPKFDLQLFSGAEAGLVSATGPENYATLFNLPNLGLNCVELFTMSHNPKSRFFPKKIFCTKRQRLLRPFEILEDPVFFQFGGREKDNPYEYHEMTEQELLMALAEFMGLVESDEWFTLTESQKAYRDRLTPLHFDLYTSKTLPCDCYLAPEMSKTNSPLVVESLSSTS